MVQNPTIPVLFDPPSIETSGRALYLQVSFDMWQNADIPRSEVCLHLLIEPSGTEAYYTKSLVTCGRMQTYPGQMYPPANQTKWYRSLLTPGQFDMWQNADIPRSEVPLTPCKSNLVVQRPTTPSTFHMWKNADIPRSDVSSANQTKWYRAL